MIPLARNMSTLRAAVLADRNVPGEENRDIMSATPILESIRAAVNTLVIGAALGALPSILISDVAAAAVNRWHRSRVPHVPYLEPPPQSPSY